MRNLSLFILALIISCNEMPVNDMFQNKNIVTKNDHFVLNSFDYYIGDHKPENEAEIANDFKIDNSGLEIKTQSIHSYADSAEVAKDLLGNPIILPVLKYKTRKFRLTLTIDNPIKLTKITDIAISYNTDLESKPNNSIDVDLQWYHKFGDKVNWRPLTGSYRSQTHKLDQIAKLKSIIMGYAENKEPLYLRVIVSGESGISKGVDGGNNELSFKFSDLKIVPQYKF